MSALQVAELDLPGKLRNIDADLDHELDNILQRSPSNNEQKQQDARKAADSRKNDEVEAVERLRRSAEAAKRNVAPHDVTLVARSLLDQAKAQLARAREQELAVLKERPQARDELAVMKRRVAEREAAAGKADEVYRVALANDPDSILDSTEIPPVL